MVELLAALVGHKTDLMEVLKATIGDLAKSSEGITLFGSSSASEKHGNFQIMPCVADKNNQITVAFLGSFFQAAQVSDDYFFVTYSQQGIGLFKTVQIFTLDDNEYGKVRDKVIEKLAAIQSRRILTNWRKLKSSNRWSPGGWVLRYILELARTT